MSSKKQQVYFGKLLLLLVPFFFMGCVNTRIATIANYFQCESSGVSVSSIVGGKDVALDDSDQSLVTMLKIRRDTHESVCTGSVISDHIILTAAHCVLNVDPKKVSAQFVTASGCPQNQKRKMTAEIVDLQIHPDFDGTPQSLSDLALLYLKESAPRDQVRLTLIKSDEKPTEDKILLLGFGITQEDKNDSQVLRRIEKSIQKDIVYRDRSLVIKQTNESGGFCRGDSGAPILADVWGKQRIMGVNSANIGIEPNTECHQLSLAIDTAYFTDWIEQTEKKLDSSNWWSRFF